MLPDFPRIKKELDDIITVRLRLLVYAGDPVLSQIGRSLQHEGDEMTYDTLDGGTKTMDYKPIESVLSLRREDLRGLAVRDILNRIDTLAADMSRQAAKLMFDRIGEVCEASGNRVDAGGRPFTFEIFYEMLDRVQIDFDEKTAKPKMPSLVVGPAIADKLPTLFGEWDADPALHARLVALIEKKRQEWHDRESHRKLVD
jgi:hypothetical protein